MLDAAPDMSDAECVVTRTSKASAPAAADALTASDVPVTCAMLGSVRTELLQRLDHVRGEVKTDVQKLDAKIDAAKAELKADVQKLDTKIDAVKAELKADVQKLDAKIDAVKAELKADIQAVKVELKADIQAVKADVQAVKADVQAVKADMSDMRAHMARIEFLVEEQNTRNKIVLDGLTAMLARQDRVEERLDRVEDTVRDLASARRSGG